MSSLYLKSLKLNRTCVATTIVVCSVLLSNCSQDTGLDGLDGMTKKGSGRLQNDNATNELFDFAKECGIPQEKLENKDAVLVDGNYTSFPIIVQGTSMGTGFTVVTQAKLQVSATAQQTTQNLQVDLKDSAADASGIAALIAPAIVKSKAKAAAAKSSGTTITKSLPKGEWLKLTNGKSPEYKDLLCATSGIKTVQISKGGGTSEVTYTPTLISSINPLAPMERMRKEFGQGKRFNVTANVVGSSGFIVAGTYQGTVTVQEIGPSFTHMDSNVTTDIAYEFVNDFPGGAYKLGLPRRQIIYIDAKKKVIRAIVNEDDRIDDTTQKVIPPAVLIRD